MNICKNENKRWKDKKRVKGLRRAIAKLENDRAGWTFPRDTRLDIHRRSLFFFSRGTTGCRTKARDGSAVKTVSELYA